jgi:hypothetical protein
MNVGEVYKYTGSGQKWLCHKWGAEGPHNEEVKFGDLIKLHENTHRSLKFYGMGETWKVQNLRTMTSGTLNIAPHEWERSNHQMVKIQTDVYELWIYKDFLPLLCKLYNLTEDQAQKWIVNCGQYRGWSNGHNIVADVCKSEFEEYEEWLLENAPPNEDFIDSGIETILCDAANRGLVPEGKYIVHYSW